MGGFLGFGNPSGTTSIPVSSGSQFRPPQWAKPAMVMISVPQGGTSGTSTPTDQVPTGYSVNGVQTLQEPTTLSLPVSYVFDAVLALEHEQSITKTQHPVQTGAAISSHAYVEPATLVLYVLMSDVTPQYVAANQPGAPYVQSWTGAPSKSVSAYQQMLKLQMQRVPLTVVTRLRTYGNMLILRLAPREDDKTITGARFRMELGQVFLAGTQVNPVSVRPNDTQATGQGAVNTQPPSAAVQSQFGVSPFAPGPDGPSPDVPLPPDLGNGSIPSIVNGIPGYLTPGTGDFTPQYPNTVTKINVPGASVYSSNAQAAYVGAR